MKPKTTHFLHSILGCTLLLIWFNAIAQPSLLCQGDYYSEKEGAEKLRLVQQSIHSLKDWEAHADSIRQQIRKGIELETFPVKTPLNPHYRNKKILDGYSVEAVVFEIARFPRQPQAGRLAGEPRIGNRDLLGESICMCDKEDRAK